jgi:hypothetical protein
MQNTYIQYLQSTFHFVQNVFCPMKIFFLLLSFVLYIQWNPSIQCVGSFVSGTATPNFRATEERTSAVLI